MFLAGASEVPGSFLSDAEAGRNEFGGVCGPQRRRVRVWLLQRWSWLCSSPGNFYQLFANEQAVYYKRYPNEQRYHTGTPQTA